MKSRSMMMLALLCLAISQPGHAEITSRQVKLLENNCLQCHARENIGAPIMGRPEDWKDRKLRGEEALLLSVVQGRHSMPPLGYCSVCDENDLRALTRQISGLGDVR